MGDTLEVQAWLRQQCAQFVFRPEGVYVANGEHDWPLVAGDAPDLTAQLEAGGHLVSLPKESAALANVIEVALVDFILERIAALPGAQARRGEERSYPDLEVSGEVFGGGFHAVDIKLARLNKSGRQTQSRCTLYTGNTYFKWPTIRWPRDVPLLRGLRQPRRHHRCLPARPQLPRRVRELELFVHEPWRIASRDRSSTTREYIGAVVDVEALRQGQGAFATEEEFYRYWRAFPFRIPKAVERQLEKALAETARERGRALKPKAPD